MELESLFGMLPLTLNQRPEVSGYGLVFGAVVAKASGGICVQSATYQYQDAIRRIFTILKETRIIPNDFVCSSFQLLHSAEVLEHVDVNANVSLSFITGEFSGGA